MTTAPAAVTRIHPQIPTGAAAQRPPVDLAGRVRDACRALPNGSTVDICRAVWETLIGPEYAQALREALPVFVEQQRAADRQAPAPKPAPSAAGTSRSWKTDAARKYAAEWLAERVDVTDEGDWKPLADCTVLEVRAAAEHHLQRASRVAARALWLQSVADAMSEEGAVTAADLPAVVIAELAPPS